uniref:ATP synthase F0 subunit 8 n=1 Tax=Leptychaster arcticus TaxID=3048001 RepID=UPI00286D260F|nr:ATP synthase F0 subunit 8 [Leptychaster arcticus]WKD83341.1 ATP synthase F0 subunit 8 [Leptychaster arcticus]
MPQLNLAWWLFNFILGWLSLILLITIISNKSLITFKTPLSSSSKLSTINNNWPWN